MCLNAIIKVLFIVLLIVSVGIPVGGFRFVAGSVRCAYPSNAYELVVNYIAGPKGRGVNFCLLEVV